MSQKNLPAFPGPSNTGYQEGMTLRDYFAAQALIGLVTNGHSYADAARHAYASADAMMDTRNDYMPVLRTNAVISCLKEILLLSEDNKTPAWEEMSGITNKAKHALTLLNAKEGAAQ